MFIIETSRSPIVLSRIDYKEVTKYLGQKFLDEVVGSVLDYSEAMGQFHYQARLGEFHPNASIEKIDEMCHQGLTIVQPPLADIELTFGFFKCSHAISIQLLRLFVWTDNDDDWEMICVRE